MEFTRALVDSFHLWRGNSRCIKDQDFGRKANWWRKQWREISALQWLKWLQKFVTDCWLDDNGASSGQVVNRRRWAIRCWGQRCGASVVRRVSSGDRPSDQWVSDVIPQLHVSLFAHVAKASPHVTCYFSVHSSNSQFSRNPPIENRVTT